MSKPFDADHPEQVAYDQTCSMWLTEGTNDREKHAYRDGHHAARMLERFARQQRAALSRLTQR